MGLLRIYTLYNRAELREEEKTIIECLNMLHLFLEC